MGHAAASWAARLEAKRFKRSAAVFSAASSAACFVTTLTVFKRKHIRLATGRYQGRNLYFVTLCFHNRRRLGANAHVASWLASLFLERSQEDAATEADLQKEDLDRTRALHPISGTSSKG